MNAKTKTTFMVMCGGGIGECQSTRNVTTPLAAIKQWVRGQNPDGKYTAPMDTWIHAPTYYEDECAWKSRVDVPRVREFYQWILNNENRLHRELCNQNVYVAHMYTDRAKEYALKYLAMSDEELADEMSYETLHPFSGG
jgi:hypothetical protein